MRRFAAVLCFAVLLIVPQAHAATATGSIRDAPIRTVRAGQGTIGYRDVGHGRPLVLIMGLSGTMDSWEPVFADALARGRRVIAFDNEGIRRTTLGPGTLTVRRMGDDVAALITHLRLGRADVLGWSMGGMIAQALARAHPSLVRRLILCATAPGDGTATLPAADVLAQLSGGTANAAGLLGLLFPPGRDADTQSFVSALLSYPNPATVAPDSVTQAQLAATGAWLAGKDPLGRPLRRLRLPVLVAGGALDVLLPVANQRRLAAAIQGAQLRIYPAAAHGFLFQERVAFVNEVRRFLSAP